MTVFQRCLGSAMDNDLFTYGKTSRVGARGMAALRQKAQAQPSLPRKKGGRMGTSSSDEDSSPERRRGRKRSRESVAARLKPKAVAVDTAEDGDTTSSEGLKSAVKPSTLDSSSQSSPSPSPSPPPPDFSSPPDVESLGLLEKADRALYQLKWSKVSYSSPMSDHYSSLDDSSLLVPRDDPYITLRVRCRGKVHKYKTMEVQPLSTVCATLAADMGTSPELVLLSHRNSTLSPTETPESLGLTTADIIDAVLLEESANGAPVDYDPGSLDLSQEDSSITIKIQSSKTSQTYRMSKTDPLKKAMDAFAQTLDLPVRKVKFTFDGDQVKPSSSPQDLDMESDDVIDARIV